MKNVTFALIVVLSAMTSKAETCVANCINGGLFLKQMEAIISVGQDLEEALVKLEIAAEKKCGRGAVIVTTVTTGDVKAYDFDANKACVRSH